jgi:hypothetical protein
MGSAFSSCPAMLLLVFRTYMSLPSAEVDLNI